MKALFFTILFVAIALFAIHRFAPPSTAEAPEAAQATEARSPEAPATLPEVAVAESPQTPTPEAEATRPQLDSFPAAFSFDSCRLEPVYGAEITRESADSVRMRLPSAEWSCGLKLAPPEGRRSLDLSGAKWLAIDVENLSTNRQMRLTMHVSSGGANSESADHALANFTKNRAVNTGIGLDPGEKGTMKLRLPHPDVYTSPNGAPGPFLVDTRHVNSIDLQVQWPYEDEFRYVVDCRISNLRLEGENDTPPPPAESYFPFIDRFGQYKHAEWPEKVHDASELPADLVKEEARIAASPHPAAWDRYGGWANGPHLRATGNFRTELVNGKWWLVTPAGTLFFSTGVDVLRNNTDSSDGSRHPDWHETPVPPDRQMAYPHWNLRLKFGKDDYISDYYLFCQKRLRAWGLNTTGNWAARELLLEAKIPYVASVLENARGVPRHPKFHCYDFLHPDFESKMRAAIREKFASEPSLRHAAADPLCIGFFVDNELQLSKWAGEVGAEKAKQGFDLYFSLCREEIARAAPGKLYLGSRFVGFRQPGSLWDAAAKHCDVVSVNSYANSIYNLSSKIMNGGVQKPILVGEFHFGCFDRGMFKASLCPVWSQEERGRSYARFVGGALRNPLVVGCHWFQWRDQPLIGRGDGEAYQCGFVDGADRPYEPLCSAARALAEQMYDLRYQSPERTR